MTTARSAALEDLQARIGYRFRDAALLDRALIHRSWSHEAQRRDRHGVLEDNERLEFLGDGVFYAVVGEQLFRAHPEAAEGQLTALRRHLVSGPRQVELARAWGLDAPGLVRLGHLPAGEVRRGQQKLLEDAVEAVVGAVFLDGGFDAARALLAGWVAECEPDLAEATDSKSVLQEALQARGLPTPAYLQVDSAGPGHERHFEFAALVVAAPGGAPEDWGRGEGPSKKKAQRAAAACALARLREAGVLPRDEG